MGGGLSDSSYCSTLAPSHSPKAFRVMLIYKLADIYSIFSSVLVFTIWLLSHNCKSFNLHLVANYVRFVLFCFIMILYLGERRLRQTEVEEEEVVNTDTCGSPDMYSSLNISLKPIMLTSINQQLTLNSTLFYFFFFFCNTGRAFRTPHTGGLMS